jgi:hypothetical protein
MEALFSTESSVNINRIPLQRGWNLHNKAHDNMKVDGHKGHRNLEMYQNLDL